MIYLRYLCAYTGVLHISCCVFVLFFFVLYTICCRFLFIINFLLSLRYSLTWWCSDSIMCVLIQLRSKQNKKQSKNKQKTNTQTNKTNKLKYKNIKTTPKNCQLKNPTLTQLCYFSEVAFFLFVCNKLPVYLLFDVNMHNCYEMLHLMDPGLLSNACYTHN
jgi:hypothetical protein